MAWVVPGQESFGHVTLRRGMTTTFDLWDWWSRVRRDPGRAGQLRRDRPHARPGRGAGALPPTRLPAGEAHGADPRRDGQRHRDRGAGARVRGDRHRVPGRSGRRARARRPRPRSSCASSTRASSGRSTRAAGSRRRSTPTSCGRRSATSSARRPSWTCGWPSTSARRRLEAAGRPDDVRRLTEKVAYFATPRPARGGALARPAVRLVWGTFQFDGYVETLEEVLESFSADGRPLRASLALSLARPQIAPYAFRAP